MARALSIAWAQLWLTYLYLESLASSAQAGESLLWHGDRIGRGLEGAKKKKKKKSPRQNKGCHSCLVPRGMSRFEELADGGGD